MIASCLRMGFLSIQKAGEKEEQKRGERIREEKTWEEVLVIMQ